MMPHFSQEKSRQAFVTFPMLHCARVTIMLFLTVNTAATPRSNFGQMKDDIERLNRWCWQHNKALNLERGLVLHHNLSRGTTAQQPRRSSSSRSMAYHQLSRSFRLSFLAIPCIQYLATPPICITIFYKKLVYFQISKMIKKFSNVCKTHFVHYQQRYAH